VLRQSQLLPLPGSQQQLQLCGGRQQAGPHLLLGLQQLHLGQSSLAEGYLLKAGPKKGLLPSCQDGEVLAIPQAISLHQAKANLRPKAGLQDGETRGTCQGGGSQSWHQAGILGLVHRGESQEA